MSKPIYEDPVVAEIHAIREQILRECNGDLVAREKILAAKLKAEGRVFVTKPLRDNRIKPAASTER